MKFECDSCHAKYRISDEKVRGRVVRFPCRKCNYKILIDGRLGDPDVTVPAGAAYGFDEVTRNSEPSSTFGHEAATSRARRSSSPLRRRPPSVPPRRPSAVSRRLSSAPAAASSALAGQHPGLAPPVPAGAPLASIGDVPEWHVSINDVPVGPVRLEEMGHKIDAGAVSEYSLVWRDGFEEWRPLGTVPALMALLHERRHSGPPRRNSFSSMPPFVDSRSSVDDSVAFAETLAAAPPSLHSDLPGEFEPLADSLQPEGPELGVMREMSQPPARLGPAGVFDSSPQLGSFSGLPAAPDDQVSVPSVPPPAALVTAEPPNRISLGVWALILAFAAFSGVSAYLAFDRYGDALLQDLLGKGAWGAVAAPKPAPVVVVPPPVEEAAPAAEDGQAEEGVAEAAGETGEKEAADDVTDGEGVDGETGEAEIAEPAQTELLVQPPAPAEDGPTMAPAPRRVPKSRRAPRPRPVAPAPEPEAESLSDADQKILADFGSGADAAPAKIDVERSESTKSDNPPLDGDGVRATVTTNKPRLQRCYERAVRGQQSPPAVRMDVTVTVSASGRVRNVSAEGSGPGGLAACIEASVRRWRFPASSEGGPAKFPIVFSAN